MDELNSLTYLDAVVRETLRVHPAVEFTPRAVMRDDIIPLEKPFIDTRGSIRNQVEYVREKSSVMDEMILKARHFCKDRRW